MNKPLKVIVASLAATGAAALAIDGFNNRAPTISEAIAVSVPPAKPKSRPIVIQEDADTCTLDLTSGGTLAKQGEALDRCMDALPARPADGQSFNNALAL